MGEKVKVILDGTIQVLKNKRIYSRAVKFIFYSAIIAWMVLGGHTCKNTPLGDYEYKSPLEAWRSR